MIKLLKKTEDVWKGPKYTSAMKNHSGQDHSPHNEKGT